MPERSCGMRSIYCVRKVIPGPNTARNSASSASSVAELKSAGTHDVQDDLVNGRLHHLQLFEPRYRGQRALHQRHSGHHRAVAALQIVGNPSSDALHERQATSAGAAAIRRDPDILDAVADERHAAIDEVSDDDRPLLSRRGLRTVRAQEFDVQMLDVEVHALVPLALTGNQRHLLRAIPVRDPATESRFD